MRARTALLAILTAALLVACAGPVSTAAPSGSASASSPPSVAGGPMIGNRTFVSTGTTGHALVAGTTVTLTFNDGQLGASAGCNSMSGAYVIVGDALRIDRMGSTEMGCTADRVAQDQWLAAFLPGALVDLRGAGMTLTKGGVVLTLVDRQTTNLPLEGTFWTVEAIVSGDVVASVPPGVEATLMILGRKASISTGCNLGTVAVTVTGGKIGFSPISMTARGCDAAAALVEQAILAVFEGIQPYKIDGTSLTIGGPGGREIILKAASAPPPSDPGPT